MCFDVSKVVRSPGCDHEHDEESRNGRDIKIDILEAYVWTSEVFRVKSGFFGVPGGYRNPPVTYWALVGLGGREGGRPGQGRAPFPPFRIGQGEGGGPPSFLPSTPSPPPSSSYMAKGGRATPTGSRTPPFLVELGLGSGNEEGEGKGGGAPPPSP